MPENNLSLNISCVLKSLLPTKLFHLSGLQLFPRLGADCDIIALVFCFRDFSKIRIRNKYALSFFTMASFLSGSLVLPLLYLFLFVKFFETNYRKKINPLVFLRFSFEENCSPSLKGDLCGYFLVLWLWKSVLRTLVAFFLGSRDFSGKKIDTCFSKFGFSDVSGLFGVVNLITFYNSVLQRIENTLLFLSLPSLFLVYQTQFHIPKSSDKTVKQMFYFDYSYSLFIFEYSYKFFPLVFPHGNPELLTANLSYLS